MSKLKRYLIGVFLLIIGVAAGIKLDEYIVYNVKEWTEYEIEQTRVKFIYIVYRVNDTGKEQIMITDDIAEALNYTCKNQYSKTTVRFGAYKQYTPFKANNCVTVKFNDGVLVVLLCEEDIITNKYSFYVKIEGLRYMRILEGGHIV